MSGMTPEELTAACLGTETADVCVSRLVPDDLEDRIAAAIREAVAEEREACAELVRNYIRHKLNTTDDGWTPYPDEKLIAKAIRARGLSVDEPLIVPAPASS
jgi:hypothetical protein